MANIKVSIIPKDKIAYQGEAEAVFVPTQTGIIEVLPEHMQLVSALKRGEVTLKTKDGTNKIFKILDGVLEVRSKSDVIILADLEKEE